MTLDLDELAADLAAAAPTAPPPAPVAGSRAWLELALRENPDELADAVAAEFERRAAEAELAEFERMAPKVVDSMFEFAVEAFQRVLEPSTPLELNWHHRVACDHVQWQLEERQKCADDPSYWSPAQNLIVNQPPRCLKTLFITVCGPAWAWLRWPHLRVRALCTNPRVSNGAAYATFRLVTSDWYKRIRAWAIVNRDFQSWDLDPKRSAPTNLYNLAGGVRVAAGYFAEIVGEGSDWLIIDDANDPEDVESETQREAVNDRYENSIESRVNHPRVSCRTNIQQRTHAEDLTGHLLAGGAEWVHLCIPQEFGRGPKGSTSTPIWRDPRTELDELLHPSRFSREWCDAYKTSEDGGTLRFNIQHNQNPEAADGNMLKVDWFKRVDPGDVPALTETVISLDMLGKKWAKSKKSSRAALVGVGRTGGYDRYVLDCWAKRRVGVKEVAAEVVAMYGRLTAAFTCGVVRLLWEGKALGPSVVDELEDQLKSLNVPNVEVEPAADKDARVLSIQPIVEVGNVAVLRAPWAPELLAEVCGFPLYATDDITDALAQALDHLRANPRISAFRQAFGKRRR